MNTQAQETYFPNISAKAMKIQNRAKVLAAELTEAQRGEFYELLSECHSEFVQTRFPQDKTESGYARVLQAGTEIVFPKPIPLVKYGHILCGYEEWLKRKYSLPGFLAVEPGDVVVDCGAYIGGFSLSAARIAAEVHVFEPESRNFHCCTRNLSGYGNVILNQTGLYSESRTIAMNISESSVEHSILPPDDGIVTAVSTINVVNLYDYSMRSGLSEINFLKLEAEGVEPEIYEGLRGIRPRKIAIDISPERNGESPVDHFISVLGAAGYELQRRNAVLFARLN